MGLTYLFLRFVLTMRNLILALFCLASLSAIAQPSRPKLVVGLVIDQMRWDYLHRFSDRYGSGGFKRLLNEGFSCDNTFINYVPTHTAPGHATIYTGSVPALHGIAGNSWYDPGRSRVVYCTEDSSVTTVGGSSTAGQMSPRNLWSNTIADELRLATNFRGRTIGISMKDRGGILPVGHMASAAYWFDNATGGWISSSYYMKELPAWMQKFNARKLPDQYLAQNWNTLYPISTYVNSTADSNRYESKLSGGGFTFPHITSKAGDNRYEVFRYTPHGNSFTLETAKEAVRAEKLGKGNFTDLLAVSLSSTDYAGHSFGPNSVELEDMFLRLDRDLASFLNFLDQQVGKGQYLLFLTADHGAAHNPLFIEDRKGAASVFNYSAAEASLRSALEKEFGTTGIIEHATNYQFYLNHRVISEKKLNRKDIAAFISKFLLKYHDVSHVVDLHNLHAAPLPAEVARFVQNGYNQKLSGDILMVLKPQVIMNWRTGTTHGLWNPYDAHIPLVWFGWKVKHGSSSRETYMTDIAPTLATMLKIQMPNASIGKAIPELTTH